MAMLSRNAKVLRFLLDSAPGIGRVKLAKYAYLVDVEGFRHLGRQISKFEYIRDSYGPFDSDGFYRAIDELKAIDAVSESAVTYPGGYHGFEYTSSHIPLEYDFTVAEAEILRYVAATYKSLSARDLCDEVVYLTEPMRNSEPGRPLPMDRIKRSAPEPLGFDLDRMLLGEASARDGRYRPISDAVDGLRTRYNS